jgi:hypothetical protein
MIKEKVTVKKSSSRPAKTLKETPSYTPLKANKQKGYTSTPIKLYDDINRELESPVCYVHKSRLYAGQINSIFKYLYSNSAIIYTYI